MYQGSKLETNYYISSKENGLKFDINLKQNISTYGTRVMIRIFGFEKLNMMKLIPNYR